MPTESAPSPWYRLCLAYERKRLAFTEWRWKRRNPQRTFIYCPSCKSELVAGGEWLGQEVKTMFEAYRCNQCGTLSTWDFDTYPVPVRVEV